MTLEQRIARAERMIAELARLGRRARAELRAEHREMNEKINILIYTQIETGEQIKTLAFKTDEQIKALGVSQAKTDEALRRFIDSLRNGRNGISSG